MDNKIDLYLQMLWDAVTFEFALKLAILYFFITWIVLIIWVIKDISIRTNNIFYQIFSVLIILSFTPFGIFIYLLIRPRRTLYDKYYEEIEENLDIFNDSFWEFIIVLSLLGLANTWLIFDVNCKIIIIENSNRIFFIFSFVHPFVIPLFTAKLSKQFLAN